MCAVIHSQFTILWLCIQYGFVHMCDVNQFYIIGSFADVKPYFKARFSTVH